MICRPLTASSIPLNSTIDLLSPLRTDSRQLVSKIYWWQSAKNGIMRELEWREPTGFVWFAPAGGGNLWVDVNGGSSKITRTAEAAM